MATNKILKDKDGIIFNCFSVKPDAVSGARAVIPAGVKAVKVEAVTNDANDWIILPSLARVPDGHEITLLCTAGGNFELRTKASSTEKINGQNCDGTKEYLCTDTEVVKIVKISNTVGWMAHGYSAIGAVVTAVVPD